MSNIVIQRGAAVADDGWSVAVPADAYGWADLDHAQCPDCGGTIEAYARGWETECCRCLGCGSWFRAADGQLERGYRYTDDVNTP